MRYSIVLGRGFNPPISTLRLALPAQCKPLMGEAKYPELLLNFLGEIEGCNLSQSTKQTPLLSAEDFEDGRGSNGFPGREQTIKYASRLFW